MTQKIKEQKQNGFLHRLHDLFPVVSFCLLTAVVMTGCGGWGHPTPAANAVASLITSNDPAVIQTLKNLRQLAAKNGSVRVIVGVRVAFVSKGMAPELQRAEIAAAQSAVLNRVASLKQKLQPPKLFATIPFMAIEVTPSELETLVSLPEITSIEEDRLATQFDAQSDSVMGATTAWSSGYSGAGQTIAILDSGVDKTHPFLTGKVVSEACYSSNNATDGATSVCPGGVTQSTATGSAMPYTGTCPTGGCDHGTVVAGIAAGNNGSFFGVAKDASLIAIQVFSRFDSIANCGSATPCTLTYTSDQIMGLQQVYALRNTYHIAAVNMSLGSGQNSSQSTCDAANPSIKAAIDILRSVNIPTIIASGNNGYLSSMSAPGCISSAISVGATFDVAGYSNNCAGNNLGISSIDAILCESNSASFLNLLAPGAEITSSIPGGGYAAWYGTSMAAPQVAGAWAIMMQKNTSLTVTTGLSALSSTGVPINDPRNSIVKPRIQINSALNAI
jgi:subtilisin family serine protease